MVLRTSFRRESWDCHAVVARSRAIDSSHHCLRVRRAMPVVNRKEMAGQGRSGHLGRFRRPGLIRTTSNTACQHVAYHSMPQIWDGVPRFGPVNRYETALQVSSVFGYRGGSCCTFLCPAIARAPFSAHDVPCAWTGRFRRQ